MHLQVVDVDRNNLLNEQEYVKFVHQIVAYYDRNISFHNHPTWGNRLDDLPLAVQVNYDHLNQGGAIEILGYRPNDIGTIVQQDDSNSQEEKLLRQQRFLIQVCVHTEVAVHQVLTHAPQQPIPDVTVVAGYSSFALHNTVGIRSQDLMAHSHNRKALDLAYPALVTQVVSEKTGVSLTNPALTRRRRRRRQLTVAIDPHRPQIYRIDNVECPGVNTTATPAALITEWCQEAFGQFLLYYILVGQQPQDVDEYSQAVQVATEEGRLQQILQQIDPTAEVTVVGAASSIKAPPPTPSPTHAPHPVPTAAPHTLTVVTVAEEEEPDDNLVLIFTLAGVLMTINCCIIGVSMYMCLKNRNQPILDDDDDDLPEDYYRLQKNRKKKLKKKKKRSGRFDYDPNSNRSDTQSNPPTLEEIEAANTMPVDDDDARQRDRIMSGQPLPAVYEEDESSLPVSGGQMA
ncbi:expressed unknown protein [Seminavis robusta]|uniref:EF-hand domain-containing protein n=1 Tax=Seminavis robusta TaxID=568900 RepID=A0A9N8D9C3_9STRA|nr:expressed unknown protein [Seminavis robusta]|eukprot:Sro6_g005620.1 n/a (458) ;mRNA; f:260534-262065